MAMPEKQRGAVLIISLVLLVAMTLLGVASINSSTVNLRIVGNLQSQKDAESAAQEGVELVLNSANLFMNPPNSAFSESVSNNRTVVIEEVTCRSSVPAQGYSATMTLVPEDNTWRVTASHEDPDGASVRVQQGVRLRQLNGSCP
ncbi:MAG: PilX N-terminal domain-containing pilus assembly protein [Aquisalimonadaceae bacterium]